MRPLYPIWTQAIFERKMGKFKIPACIALFLREKLVARVYNMFLYIIVAGEEKTRRIRGDIAHAHSKVRCSIGLIQNRQKYTKIYKKTKKRVPLASWMERSGEGGRLLSHEDRWIGSTQCRLTYLLLVTGSSGILLCNRIIRDSPVPGSFPQLLPSIHHLSIHSTSHTCRDDSYLLVPLSSWM